MLANIASIEPLPVTETLAGWLFDCSDDELSALHTARHDIDERAFYPRILIGAYYHDQLNKLVERATARGHQVNILTGHRVVDVIVHQHDVVFQVETAGTSHLQSFDYAVIASGHQERDGEDKYEQLNHAYAKREAELWRNARIGVLGTSLSAIDVAIGTAAEAGYFERRDGKLYYLVHDAKAKFSVTLMSRRGLLPEADFYCPISYEPLIHFTAEQVAAICSDGKGDCLNRIFELFKTKLSLADPGYADGIGLASLTPDNFADVYFTAGQRVSVLDWAEANLAEAKANARARKTMPWRYAILRMNEDTGISKIAAKDNAAANGEEYFDIMIDARGQPALTLKELPFPTLRLQILTNKKANHAASIKPFAVDDSPQLLNRGIDVGETFALYDGLYNLSRVYCLAVPHLLKMHPFIQGLTSCNTLAQAMAASLVSEICGSQREGRSTIPDNVAHFDETSLVCCLANGQQPNTRREPGSWRIRKLVPLSHQRWAFKSLGNVAGNAAVIECISAIRAINLLSGGFLTPGSTGGATLHQLTAK